MAGGVGDSKLMTFSCPFSSFVDINSRAQRSNQSGWKRLRQGGLVPSTGTLEEAESTAKPTLPVPASAGNSSRKTPRGLDRRASPSAEHRAKRLLSF